MEIETGNEIKVEKGKTDKQTESSTAEKKLKGERKRAEASAAPRLVRNARVN